MLNYSASEEMIKEVAIFYSDKVGSPVVKSFFAGESAISNPTDAIEIATAFWEMTSLASEDHLNNVDVLEGIDLEFWMYKLFNKVQGYFDKNGYKDQWKLVSDQISE